MAIAIHHANPDRELGPATVGRAELTCGRAPDRLLAALASYEMAQIDWVLGRGSWAERRQWSCFGQIARVGELRFERFVVPFDDGRQSALGLEEHADRIEYDRDVVIALGTVDGLEEQRQPRARTVRVDLHLP
jgi:hypothetical protein